MRVPRNGMLIVVGALGLVACNNSAQTNETANATASATKQAAREAAREMHNQMSAGEMEHDRHSGTQGGMHDMDNMQSGSGNMRANSMNNSMPMKDDSDHM